MSQAVETNSPAVVIDTWQKAAGLLVSAAGALVAAILALNTLMLAPVAARVDRVESATHQAERDRAEVLQRISALEQAERANGATLGRIERLMERAREPR